MPILLNATVIVAALGYFVDIYDLILFSIVRVPSLQSLGFSGPTLLSHGVLVLNMQMTGMLLGGLAWGVLGDKKGRLSVLFGSIILYSIANFANGFVHTIEAYAALRFVAGIGLAGELGAGITLVSELLPKERRGWGTSFVAAVGLMGALLAGTIAEAFDWRIAYFIGGGLGLGLLFLRIGVLESKMFQRAKEHTHLRGDFRILFKPGSGRLRRYLCCILIGVPLWYVIGVLITYSPELAREAGVTEPIAAGRAVMALYLGQAIGDLLGAGLSQVLRSRKKALAIFMATGSVAICWYLLALPHTANGIYLFCLLFGIAIGYWALFVTIAAEQFGTNIRSTVATTVPNFVRGSLVPVSFSFAFLQSEMGLKNAALVLGGVVMAVAIVAAFGLRETFSDDLNYMEQ